MITVFNEGIVALVAYAITVEHEILPNRSFLGSNDRILSGSHRLRLNLALGQTSPMSWYACAPEHS
jgi:hypothetical protein